MAVLQRFLRDETAATAIEYSLIAAGVSITIVAIVNSLGTNINSIFFGRVATALK